MNKTQQDKATKALAKAKAAAGGGHSLARALTDLMRRGEKITPQAVNKWTIAPPNRVLLIEQATGVTRTELRPDYYPAK